MLLRRKDPEEYGKGLQFLLFYEREKVTRVCGGQDWWRPV